MVGPEGTIYMLTRGPSEGVPPHVCLSSSRGMFSFPEDLLGSKDAYTISRCLPSSVLCSIVVQRVEFGGVRSSDDANRWTGRYQECSRPSETSTGNTTLSSTTISRCDHTPNSNSLSLSYLYPTRKVRGQQAVGCLEHGAASCIDAEGEDNLPPCHLLHSKTTF